MFLPTEVHIYISNIHGTVHGTRLRTKYVHVCTLLLRNGKITRDLNRVYAAGSHEFTQIRCVHEFHDLRYLQHNGKYLLAL